MAAFQDFQKHCTLCKRGKPCGENHVYVLQLDTRIWENKSRFKEENPNYKIGMDCLYVGRTGHLPKCRASMHVKCRKNVWSKKSFHCYCSGKKKMRKCSCYSKASEFVAEYNLYHLRGKLFKKHNPQYSRGESKKEEVELTEELRSKGYGVWSK